MHSYRNITGTVFNIQRFTIHDGPGIRTEVFLKGCTLRCKWCSNPESIHPAPEIAVHPLKCIGVDVCGACRSACVFIHHNALKTVGGKISGIDRAVCDNCLACAAACPSDALFVYGKIMTVEQVLEAVMADREYYRDNGGVTFSGGEPFLQFGFLKECLRACKDHGINICVESALYIPAEHLIACLPLMDLLIFDLKVMDEERHRRWTGRSNRQILENVLLLAETDLPLVIRIPVVPGYNDDEENIEATAGFIREKLGRNVRQVQLLRYRPLGQEKYMALGKTYPMTNFRLPERSEAEKRIKYLADRMAQMGVPAVAGTTTAF